MIDGKAIKNAVERVTIMHAMVGSSFIRLEDGEIRKDCANATVEGQEYKEKGRKLSPKKLRGWLFARRKHPAMTSDPVLWSAYDDANDVSVAALAEIKP